MQLRGMLSADQNQEDDAELYSGSPAPSRGFNNTHSGKLNVGIGGSSAEKITEGTGIFSGYPFSNPAGGVRVIHSRVSPAFFQTSQTREMMKIDEKLQFQTRADLAAYRERDNF